MFRIKVNSRKNRIYLKVSDIDRKALKCSMKAFERACLSMRPNFTCLSDFRNYGLHDEENNALFAQLQKNARDVGLAKAVRVVSSEERQNYEKVLEKIPAAGYAIEVVTDIKDAEARLDRYDQQISGGKKPLRQKMFKIIGKDGWEDHKRFKNFMAAQNRLLKLRLRGRKNSIIVNAGVQMGRQRAQP